MDWWDNKPMDETKVLTKINDLRGKYAGSRNPIDKKIIEIRGKLLKRALQIVENRKPIQGEFLEES